MLPGARWGHPWPSTMAWVAGLAGEAFALPPAPGSSLRLLLPVAEITSFLLTPSAVSSSLCLSLLAGASPPNQKTPAERPVAGTGSTRRGERSRVAGRVTGGKERR